MPNRDAEDIHMEASNPTAITYDLLNRHRTTGNIYRASVLLLGILFVSGVIGFLLRLQDGVSNTAIWGYHAAIFAFILTAAQAAPMVAIAPRLAKAHWRRPISRSAELFTAVGLFNILLFIPLLWVLPGLDDGRRSLWFYGDIEMPVFMPHIISSLALLILVICGVALLWVSSLPDLAAIRDSSTGRRQKIFKRLANGWNGTSRQWKVLHHRLGILGAFYFMMLVFVHFLISVDFAMALIPGWVDALFPATHAHNALQAGVATVLLTMFVLRQFGGYKDYIGYDQFWGLGKLLFALSLLWIWFWFSSFNVLWYGKKPNEQAAIELLMMGPYRAVFIAVFVLNFIVPFFAMIWNPVRRSIWGPTIIAAAVLTGTLLDRIRIYVAAFSVAGVEDKHSLHKIEQAAILPQLPDVLIWVGALAGSVLVYILAARVFPVVNIWEQKELLLYKVHKPFHRTEVTVLGKPE